MLRKETVVRLIWFSLANAALCLLVFRDAIWGGSLLAPLDIAPSCFSYYRFVDPSSSGLIQGNTQFDQVVYDLPLQYGIYHAYRRGEMPWWDPYGFGGRPLLADAHINGTDPIRLLAYALLPFESAYNWTLIGHFFCSGLAMFGLLQYWGMRGWICVLWALTFEFAGSQVFFFGFPWLHGSLLYYPILWLGWDAALRTGNHRWWAMASLAIAAIFYSGNLQSHSYLVLFAAAFGVGYGGVSWAAWHKLLPMLFLCGLCGACLAAPVLFNQIEFFMAGVRPVKPSLSSRVYLTGVACLSSIYPWMFGDFRTLDVRSAFFQSIGFGQNYGLGFHTFIGSAALVLALVGSCGRCRTVIPEGGRRAALTLVLLFLLIVSSPLIAVFYTRSAGLFVLGAVVLAAAGLQKLSECKQTFGRLGLVVATGAIAIALATNLGALVFYPRLLPKVRQIMEQRESSNTPGAVFKMPSAYRAFQISNLPNEVSFKNPETVFALASLLSLSGILLWPSLRSKSGIIPLLLVLNLTPMVLFATRFIPRQPMALWHRLLAGGPEQQNAIKAVGPNHLRLLEKVPQRNDYLFPDAMEHLYQVRTVHGYSALIPKSLHGLSLSEDPAFRSQVADYVFEAGELRKTMVPGLSRFRWLTPSDRAVQLEGNSLNEIRLRLGPGRAAPLLWTDTHYAGWTATVDRNPLKLEWAPPCFTKLHIPANASQIVLKYRPRFLSIGLCLSLVGAAGMAVMWAAPRLRTAAFCVQSKASVNA